MVYSNIAGSLGKRLDAFRRLVGADTIQTEPDRPFSDEDLAYMGSLAAAVVQREPRPMYRVLAISAMAFVTLLVGMGIFELDITVRGDGKVIPAQQVQLIQSLEGGVVSEILVREGDEVDISTPLMRISDIAFASSFEENRQRYLALKAKIARLHAEASGTPFMDDPEVAEAKPSLLESERSLYESHLRQLEQGQDILEEQVHQAKSELTELEAKKKQLTRSVDLIQQELAIKGPLVKKQLVSEVEYLQLKRQVADIEGELESVTLSIPRLTSKIHEAQRKREEARLNFQNDAKTALNEARAEAAQIAEAQTGIMDRVRRTVMRSPVTGTVKRIHINTIGGVIKPGSDVIEIVPSEDALLIEARIKPSDIANITVRQIARVKFSAYDFAIYGSLQGEVNFVGADTITNEKDETYYVVRIRPEHGYLGPDTAPLPIKVGMISQVDILTGKRTILNYLLKPITRGLQNALQER